MFLVCISCIAGLICSIEGLMIVRDVTGTVIDEIRGKLPELNAY
jgi:hypothetical protein